MKIKIKKKITIIPPELYGICICFAIRDSCHLKCYSCHSKSKFGLSKAATVATAEVVVSEALVVVVQ